MKCELAAFLALIDGGATVAELIDASGLQESRVYGLIRTHRPDRPRQKRRQTSELPRQIKTLNCVHDIKPQRIAALLEISPAYVYKVLGPMRTD